MNGLKKRVGGFAFLLLCLLLLHVNVVGAKSMYSQMVPSTITVDRTITDETTGFYVYTNPLFNGEVTNKKDYISKLNSCYLYVQNSKQILQKVKYSANGKIKVIIPRQKSGTKLRIFFKNGNVKSGALYITVKNLNSICHAKYTNLLGTPKVKFDKTGLGIYVVGHKNTDVVICTDKKLVKQIPIRDAQCKHINLGIKYENETIYVFTKKGNLRSKVKIIPKTIYVPDK